MKTLHFSAHVKWAGLDRELVAFTATLSDDQLSEAAFFLKAIADDRFDIQVTELPDNPAIRGG